MSTKPKGAQTKQGNITAEKVMPTKQEQGKKNALNKANYNANRAAISAQKKAYYNANRDTINAQKKANRAAIGAQKKAYYNANRDAIRARAKQSYAADSSAAKARSKASYARNPIPKQQASQQAAAAHARTIKNAKAVLRRARRYYVRHGPQCRSDARWRYELAEPKCYAKEQHVLELTKKLVLGSKVLPKLDKAFDKKYKSVSREMTTSTRSRAVTSIAAKVAVLTASLTL